MMDQPPPPPVPVGIDLGSLHARLAVTDALPLSDVPPSSNSNVTGSALPEPRVVSNAQGSRYTLAASTLDVSHPIGEYDDSNGNEKAQDPEVQFIFGEAARKTLTRHKRPLGESLVRQLSVLSLAGSTDWTTSDDETDDMETEPVVAELEQEAEGNKTAASASAAFFTNLATLACDATSSTPSQIRAVVSVPANADRKTIQGVVSSAARGLDDAIAAAEGKQSKQERKKSRRERKKEDDARIVGVLTDPAAVCVAHGLTDVVTSSGITLGGVNDNANNAGPRSDWRHALVLDWGASGLTISHMMRLGSSNVLTIVSTTNDPSLSGRTLTDLLVSHCASQFERKCRVAGVLDSKKSKARLEAACEVAIRTLGRASACHVTVDGLYEGMDLNVPVSRPRFDMLCGPTLRKAEAQVKAAKDQLASEYNNAAFDVVLLAGNVSLMPSVNAMVDRSFPANGGEEGAAPAWRGRSTIPVDEAVALGCARHAASLVDPSRPVPADEGGSADRKRFWRQEAVVLSPVTVGVCTWGDDSMKCPPAALIETGTPLPAFVSKKITLAGEDNCIGIIQVLCGESQNDCTEKLLGRINDFTSGSELAVELSKEGKLSISIDGGESVIL